ncbi:MAG: DUF2267 domain-containing protein [Hyphomonas sp.]|uniref:DUF2267 domain-containing protein n=1 Tax=Hyphomonas sp. TaxID=87 RepID=UPI0035283FC3
MPVPPEYLRVGEFFSDFLLAVREETSLATRHQSYTCLQGVLIVFRRRLTPEQILTFAQILPPAVASIFIDGWSPEEFTPEWGTRDTLTREVRHLRQHHNFAPDTAIADVARALRRTIGAETLDAALERLGPEAAAYWAGS